VGRLPAAVARASGADILTGTTVRRLTPAADQASSVRLGGTRAHRWLLETGPAQTPESTRADAVVVALPAAPAARLLRGAAPQAAVELAGVQAASVAIVTLALPLAAFPRPPASSGFLVPPADGRLTKAVTISSVKWPWLGALAGDVVVLRASVGRHRAERELHRDDDALVRVVLAELGEALGVRGLPVDSRVTRWGGALPQYAVGHVERMARARAAVDAVPGLAVCGATYDGVGVAACVASARRAATAVLDGLGVVPVSTA
ncbi:MAG: protoporphyrinogen/coproporphyrinogen oxidase, partial [Jiangellaceae bacterium]